MLQEYYKNVIFLFVLVCEFFFLDLLCFAYFCFPYHYYFRVIEMFCLFFVGFKCHNFLLSKLISLLYFSSCFSLRISPSRPTL